MACCFSCLAFALLYFFSEGTLPAALDRRSSWTLRTRSESLLFFVVIVRVDRVPAAAALTAQYGGQIFGVSWIGHWLAAPSCIG